MLKKNFLKQKIYEDFLAKDIDNKCTVEKKDEFCNRKSFPDNAYFFEWSYDFTTGDRRQPLEKNYTLQRKMVESNTNTRTNFKLLDSSLESKESPKESLPLFPSQKKKDLLK